MTEWNIFRRESERLTLLGIMGGQSRIPVKPSVQYYCDDQEFSEESGPPRGASRTADHHHPDLCRNSTNINIYNPN